MRTLLSSIILFICAFSRLGNADEIDPEEMISGIQKSAEVFELLPEVPLNKPVDFVIKLGEKSALIGDGYEFDGFRFRVPEDIDGHDFVWYFNAPAEWRRWYVVPASSEFRPGFKNWIDALKLYEDVDQSSEADRFRNLQELKSDYFVPGEELIMWFQNYSDENLPGELRGRLVFKKPDSPEQSWNHTKIESALSLTAQPAAAQVAALDSMGGKILLDETLFTKSYAEDKVDDLFYSLSQTKRLSGGFFITSEIHISPIKKAPMFAEIRKAYGAPDCSISSAEDALKRGIGKDEEKTVTHHYDYFGFKVDAADPEGRVTSVIPHASNFSSLHHTEKGDSFGQISMENLTVFLRDGKEVGRAYFFLESTKKVHFIKVPPKATYAQGDQTLEFLGNGKWTWKSLHDDGSTARTIPFVANRMQGEAIGYHTNGKVSFKGTYKKGALHGALQEFDSDGNLTREGQFKNGKAVPDPEN